MRMLILADDDGIEHQVDHDPTDVLISCGDLCDAVITRVAQKVVAANVLAVKGNHDSSGPFLAPIVDLHLKQHVLSGVRFGGFAGSWRYKPRGNYLFDQEEVAYLLADFPSVDVVVAHNSPRGIHDRDDNVHYGFEAFIDYIHRAQPKLFIHGHQHIERETQIGSTRVIGVYGLRRMQFPVRSI